MKYEFNNKSDGKITCPYCNEKKSFRIYKQIDGKDVTNENGEIAGICDKANKCGVFVKPHSFMAIIKPVISIPDPIVLVLDHDKKEQIKLCLLNDSSNFHSYCKALGIPQKHLKAWGVGTDKDKTIFTFIDANKTPVNVKYFKYLTTGSRDKEFNSYSLKGRTDGIQEYKFRLCLFGEHLLSKENNKYVIIVESEKTAIIAALFYPKYDWVSCGSASGLTDEKAKILKGRVVIWLCDSDKAGRENSSIKTLKRQRIKHKIVDLCPELTDGSDIADFIRDAKDVNLQKAIMYQDYEMLDKPPFQSQIRKRNLTKYLFAKRDLDITPNVFKDSITDKDLKNLDRLDKYLKIRVEKEEKTFELEFLALIEEVVFRLKTAYHTEATYNRQKFNNIVIEREIAFKELKSSLADCLKKNAECQSVIHSLQMLTFKNSQEIKSL